MVESDTSIHGSSNEEEKDKIEAGTGKLDPIESIIGPIGRWQMWICLLISMTKVSVAWHQLGYIFLGANTKIQCENNETDYCSHECEGIDFDNTNFGNTIIMEWELVCDKIWMKSMGQSIFMFGVLLGNMIFGILADRYGRRLPLLITVIIQLISGVSAAFVNDWYTFTAVRFIVALSNGGLMIISFVIVMEIVGAKYRQIFGCLYHIPFILGQSTLAAVAYATSDSWRSLQFWTSIPSLLYLSYYWLIPESPRWLLTMGENDKAAKILEDSLKFNGKPTKNLKDTLKAANSFTVENKAKGNIFDLFINPTIRRNTISLLFSWFACGMCFYGLSQYVSDLSGNIFTNVAIAGFIQLPGTLGCIPLNNKFGRKKTLIGAYVSISVPLLSIAVMPVDYVTLKTVFSLISMFGISIAFPTIYLYGGEIFPTVLRNTGVGLCTTSSRVGSILAPFIADLLFVKYWLPPLIFGGLLVIAALLALYLPETQGKKLPNTMDEAEKIEVNVE